MEEKKDKYNSIILENDKEKKQSPRRYSLQRSTAAAKKATVECISTTNGNIELKQSSPTATTPSSCTLWSVNGVSNNTDIEKEKESQGKKWIVKVCLDSDIKIVGKALVISLTMGVLEWCENDNEENITTTQCISMLSKKTTKKVGKVEKSF